MTIQIVNNAWSYLGANVNSAQTTIIVTDGTDFPTLGPGDYFYATLVSLTAGFDAVGNPNQCEIIKVNGPYTNGAVNLSVTRAQDGTAAANFASGDLLDVRPCRIALSELSSVAGALLAVNNLSDVLSTQTSINNLGLRVFSVRNYGAAGNGVTDDRNAINLAIAALIANNGGCLYFPVGDYRVTGTLTAISVFALVIGHGRASSIVTTNQGTGDVFTVTGQYVKFQDMQVRSSVVRTANALISASSGTANYFQMDTVTLSGGFYNLTLNANSSDIRNCSFLEPTPATGASIRINGGLDMAISHCVLTSAGAQPFAGIIIDNAGDLAMTDVQILRQGHGMYIDPAAGQVVASLTCVNCGFDNTSGRGVIFTPSSTGGIVRSRFISCWFGACGAQGFLATMPGTATINGIDFIDCQVFGNTLDGMHFATGCLNVRIIGGEVAGNGANGIVFATCTDFSVMGVKSGATGGFGNNASFGLSITGATSDRFIVCNNDFTGNTGGAWNNASTVTTPTWSLYNNLGGGAEVTIQPFRIAGDFFNASLALRTKFQSYTGNNFTDVVATPSGTGTLAQYSAYSGADMAAAQSGFAFRISATAATILATTINGGTIPTVAINCGGTRMQFENNGFIRMGQTLGTLDAAHVLQLNGNLKAWAYHTRVTPTAAAAYAAVVTDGLLLINAAANNVTITLPLANVATTDYSCSLRFKRIDSSAFVVTITRAGADLIDGAVSTTLLPLESKDLESDGNTNWYIC